MERTELSKYIDRFSVELKKFLIVLDGLMPTETIQNIIDKYEKLNIRKLIIRYNNRMTPQKEKLTQRDESMFKVDQYIIPEVNISFYWENLPVEHRKTIWENLSRLFVCSNIVMEKLSNEEKPKQEVKPHVNLFAGVGNNHTNNSDISVNSFVQETEVAKLEGNPIVKKIKEKFNMDGLSDQINNIDQESMDKITTGIKQFIDPHVADPKVSGFIGTALTDIVGKLKTHDLKNENLFDVIMQVSNEMSTEMGENAEKNNCPPEQLLASAQSILKGMGMENLSPDKLDPSKLNPAMLTELVSKMTGGSNNGETVPGSASMIDMLSNFMGM